MMFGNSINRTQWRVTMCMYMWGWSGVEGAEQLTSLVALTQDPGLVPRAWGADGSSP